MKSLFLVAGATCVAGQYAAELLGNIGLTTVAGVEVYGDLGTNVDLPVGTNIVGPFEAGFTSMQDFILAGLGCETGKGYVAGGIDTNTAEQIVAKDCGVTLPRWEGNTYVSLIGTCGGHTRDYHFHEKFSCLYSQTGAHSTQVGQGYDGKFIYGMWEHTENKEQPMLDACGGHWGPTPDSDEDTYHYHVQTGAPYTIGCYGPNPDNSLVTVEQCRALYPTCDGVLSTLETPTGSVQYDLYCPCFDANGSNTGVDIAPLPVFSTDAAKGPGGDSVVQNPSAGSSGSSASFGSFDKMGKDMGKDMSKDMGTKGKSFRVQSSEECEPTMFEIRNAKARDMCMDASKKRAALAKCDGSAAQKFGVQGGQIMNGQGDCLSSTLTFGPCAQAHTLTQMDAHHQIQLSSGKCAVAQGKMLKTRKCNDKARVQKFSFVMTMPAK